ncbi:MAG: hypothetical protein RR249_05855 [Tannerellaceae bacterium]
MKIHYFVAFLLFSIFHSYAVTDQSRAVLLQSDQINRLIPRKAILKGGIKMLNPEEPFKSFWTENWNTSLQSIQWTVTADKDEYQAGVLVNITGVNAEESIVLELSNGMDKIFCSVKATGWQRCWFDRPLRFASGLSKLTLRISTPSQSPQFKLQFYSLELVKPSTYTTLLKDAEELQGKTDWMQDINYGFFFHWNSKSMPRHGAQKPYKDAVNDFDTKKFAAMVHDCGAKLVFFTTSWAEYYFPAPIKAIDKILPGRTTSRDLIADLSDDLGKYGIKLMLYYHIGHGDAEWWNRQNFSLNDSGRLFTNLEAIIGEISLRYGSKLAGLWMDDGMGYYPNQAPFDKITRAAKSGNKDLLICYNPWIFPKLTNFQDFYAGEVGLSVEAAGKDNQFLPIGGDGRFINGPQKELQATYTGVLEPGEWTHIYKDKEIEDPLFTPEELIQIIKESNKRKNLPMMNVRIYQDGTISPKTYDLLKKVKQSVYSGNPVVVTPSSLRSTPGYRDQIHLQKRGSLLNSYHTFKQGGKARVAFLGGSITEMEGWRAMICADLKQRFPNTEFDCVAAGIGSTGSTPGAFRLEQDVLSKGKIDLLFVEAAVNDDTNHFNYVEQTRGMEGEVRHALLSNPEMDIIMLHFIYDPFIPIFDGGKTPDVILNHERVANHYLIPSINLAQEIAERMRRNEFNWKKFGGTHPAPFGHAYYAAAINQLLDEMWTADAPIKAHAIPEKPLDEYSYTHGKLIDVQKAQLGKGWQYVASWHPKDQASTRNGFVDVPMIETTKAGSQLKFSFSGTAIGLFCVAGPEAGIVEYSVDGAPFKTLDTYTEWSGNLYIPWVYMLESELENKPHQLLLRMTDKGKGTACQIRNFVVNESER